MKNKKAFVIRCGAYGDMLIVSPVFRALHDAGYEEIICHTGPRGMMILKNNPFITEFIEYKKENQENPDAEKEWEDLEKSVGAEYSKNFAESLEVNVSLHPRSPVYAYPKFERYSRGNRNFYEATENFSGLKFKQYRPDIFITQDEIEQNRKHIKPEKFNILWALSGSGANKAYPWSEFVMGELIKNDKNIHIITIGNERCQIIEPYGIEPNNPNFTNLSGTISFRETMVLANMVDCVISPDTGVLHASGISSVPKIGILGHTTIENTTKHFINDYSLEADPSLCECSPCFRLIYNHHIQCPVDKITGGAWCMAHGQPQKRLYDRIKFIQTNYGPGNRSRYEAEMSRMPPSHTSG